MQAVGRAAPSVFGFPHSHWVAGGSSWVYYSEWGALFVSEFSRKSLRFFFSSLVGPASRWTSDTFQRIVTHIHHTSDLAVHACRSPCTMDRPLAPRTSLAQRTCPARLTAGASPEEARVVPPQLGEPREVARDGGVAVAGLVRGVVADEHRADGAREARHRAQPPLQPRVDARCAGTGIAEGGTRALGRGLRRVRSAGRSGAPRQRGEGGGRQAAGEDVKGEETALSHRCGRCDRTA